MIFLCLGLALDILKFNITAKFFLDINLFNEKRSVLGTLHTLWETGNYFPFLLISLFGVMVPLVKSGFIFYFLLNKNVPSKWYKSVSTISKWAMAYVLR